ncbi:MAG: ABC transporter ATP-binding protein [Chloroflexi bacterium]|nr:ABC transporter ATP-binding protein [Chloroflexota bacterium]
MRETNVDFAVQATDLTKRFGDFLAVDAVSFRVKPGEIFGFLGPNGSGKTTTIRMLCGIVPPSSGSGRVLGWDVAREAERIKSQIGYMSQKFSLYEDLTVWENLDFFASVYGVPNGRKRERIKELVAMADLAGRETEIAANLSGGWKQRMALGCAIVHQPPVLFLDEPTSGVDPVSRRNFWEMIYALAERGVAVFVTTHYMDEAEHCDTVALMHAGKLIACDTPEALKAGSLKGDLLEIDCEPATDAIELLRRHAGVLEAAPYGVLVHVEVDAASLASQLRRALEENGIRVNGVLPVQPSLEDVFVSLIGQQLAQKSISAPPR